MAYPHALKIEGLLAVAESTYGTDPTPSASTDGVRGVGRIWTAATPEWAFPNTREDHVSGTLVQPAPGVPAGRMVAFEYTVELAGAGSAYSSSTPVRPASDALLVSCGLSRTHVDTGSAETVTYALADTGHGSSTVYIYAGGKLFKLTGCRGTFTWDINAGTLGTITFRMMGLLATTPSETSLASITYDSAVPPAAKNMSLTLNPGSSWSPATANMTVELGAQVQRLDDANSSDAIEGFFISRFDPRFRMTARTTALTTYSPYTLAAARTNHTIDLTLGSTQYNRVDLDVNNAYLMADPTPVEDNEFAAWDLEYLCTTLSLVFD